MKSATQIVLTFSPDEAHRLFEALNETPDLPDREQNAILNDLVTALEDHVEW